MTLLKVRLNAKFKPVDSGHVIVKNATLGLYETVNAPGFERSMNDADTTAAIAKLNANAYLGITTWRRPQPWEAMTQMKYVPEGVMVDLDFYPDAREAVYWTAQEVPYDPSFVFGVYFDYGLVCGYDRSLKAFCRPVADYEED